MDRDSAELSRTALELYSKELSPEYERIHNLLLGRLAAHGATVEQLAQQEVNDRKNVELLSAFTRLMPKAWLQDDRWNIRTDDPYKARVTQSHVVWSREPSGGVKLDPRRQSRPGSGIGYPRKEQEERKAQADSEYRFDFRPYIVLGAMGTGWNTKWLVGGIGQDDYTKDTYVNKAYGKVFYLEP
jgi:hypothetical protein